MDDERIDEVLRDLPRDYNSPPPPPLDEMWRVIEDAHFNATIPIAVKRPSISPGPWLAAAAALLIGIGIGRYLAPGSGRDGATSEFTARAQPARTDDGTSAVADVYRDQTNRYLGQAAALLISLPANGAGGNADSMFASRATDLLVTTRLLIDSPAAARDAKLRSLLEDLELVLVQIARLRTERDKGDLDLIHQAVEQGDVLSRLNSAVATNQSSE